jgi:hypothetical protein
VILLLSWQLGYFIVSPQMSQIEGYGWHAFNLISPINSKGWSWLMSPLKISHETNEDFNYLGIGVLACLPISIYGAYKYRLSAFGAIRKNLFLAVSLACLSFFAASNHISIGEFETHFSLAKFLETPTSLLRSSARMFWPAYYALIFLVLYLAIHTLPRKLLIIYAAIVFSVQILDSSVGWVHVKNSLHTSEKIESATPLKSPFWSLAATNYKNLKTFPLEASQMQKNWGVFSNYCALNHMGTDIVYLARIDYQKIKLSNSIFLENISNNEFSDANFYVIQPNYVANLVDLIGISHFRIIDGFYVLSPQGFFNIEIPPVDLQNIFPKITHGRGINFSSDSPESAKFLARGWSHQESWGVWSNGKEADILFPPNILVYDQIQITYRIYNPNQELKRVYVSVNAGAPKEFLIKSDGLQRLYLKIPKEASSNQLVKVHFDVPDANSPANLRGAADNRNLGIGLVSVLFN